MSTADFDIEAARRFDPAVASSLVAVFLMGSQGRGERPAAPCACDIDCCVVVDAAVAYDRLYATVRAGMSGTGRLEVCPRTVGQMRVSRKFTFDLCTNATDLYLKPGARDPRDSVPRPLSIPDNDIGSVLMSAIEYGSLAVDAVHHSLRGCTAILAAEKSLHRLGDYAALDRGVFPLPRVPRNQLVIGRHPDLAPDLELLASLRSLHPVVPPHADDAVAAVMKVCARELKRFMEARGLDAASVGRLLADPEHQQFAEALAAASRTLAGALEKDAACLRGKRGREFAARYLSLIEDDDGLTFKPPQASDKGYHVFK